VWQFSWLVDLHKNYCKTSVAIQLTCGSPQELLQSKCMNSINLWISTTITANQVWQFSWLVDLHKNYCKASVSWLVDLHKNYCKTSVVIQLTCESPQELLQNKCGNSIDLWISTRVTAKQVYEFHWLVDLYKNYYKLSVAIQGTCGSPRELLQTTFDIGISRRTMADKCQHSDFRRNLLKTRPRKLHKNLGKKTGRMGPPADITLHARIFVSMGYNRNWTWETSR
jgi:hypothetical protein